MIHGGNVWQGDRPEAWLDYSANIRPEGAPGWVKEALEKAMSNLSYYPDLEMKKARAALGEYLNMPDEYVLPAAGGISAINLAVHMESTDMLQFTPCFAEYSMLAGNLGKTIRGIPLLNGRREIGEPAEIARERVLEGSMVWLCNPLNPVGCAFGRGQIERLIGLCEEKKAWLIIDEAFIEYCPEYSAVQLVKEHGNLLITGSMTKILGIPGVRLGYLCAQPEVIDVLSRHQLTWELSCFAESVLCALPEHRNDIAEDARLNRERRRQLKAGLEEMGIYVYPSESAFLLADFDRPVDEVAEYLRGKGILVRKCMNFEGIDDGCHLRLAVKDERSNNKLLETLREAMVCAENP